MPSIVVNPAAKSYQRIELLVCGWIFWPELCLKFTHVAWTVAECCFQIDDRFLTMQRLGGRRRSAETGDRVVVA